MAGWQEVLAKGLSPLETTFDGLRYRLQRRLGGPDTIKILTYDGYGTPEKIYLKGRVIEDPGVGLSEANDSLWENMLNMYRRLESDEVPNARLVARYAGQEQQIQANEEGFFEVWFEPQGALQSGELWQKIELELLSPIPHGQQQPVNTIGRVMVPPPSAQYAVISDIDDTVVHSDATHLLRMARTVFLGNAYTRLPFPGVAALYRALHAGADQNCHNPLFFVSSSPWNLYDLLAEFFHLQDIPNPVIFLRDWGLTDKELFPLDNRGHKLALIRQILDTYPQTPFILIGDSGQQDPEIYYEVVDNFPDRVMAVYIRNVSRDLKRPEAIRALAEKVVKEGSVLVLADDSAAIARHAFEKGWIHPNSFPDIQQEKKKDEAPPTPVEKILGEEDKAEGPTVVVGEGESKGQTQAAVQEGAIEEALEETGDKKKDATPTVVVEPEKKSGDLREDGERKPGT